MAKSPTPTKSDAVPIEPPKPEAQFVAVKVCVIPRNGTEAVDVYLGETQVDVSKLRKIESGVSLAVALGRRKIENAKIATELQRNPF